MQHYRHVITGMIAVFLSSLACGPQPSGSVADQPRLVVEVTWTPSDPTVTAPVVTASPAPTVVVPPQASGGNSPACTIPSNWQPYVVRSGDTLFQLAQRYGLTTNQLRDGNCLSDTALQVGQTLYVPPGSGGGGSSATEESTEEPTEEATEEVPAGNTINIAEELTFGGGGGDGIIFECPTKASGAIPTSIFGRDKAPYTFSKLCLYDITLVVGNAHTLTLTAPDGHTWTESFLLDFNPAVASVFITFEGDYRVLYIYDMGGGKSRLELTLFMPPSMPAGKWQIEVDNGDDTPATVEFIVPAYNDTVFFVVPPESTPFFYPGCCLSGATVRYEGAGFTPNHQYVLGGYSVIAAEEPATRIFQTPVTTNANGIYVYTWAVPAVYNSVKYCLALLDTETEEILLEDVTIGSLCRAIVP